MTREMDLSTIIVTYNAEKYIMDCLRSVHRTSVGLSHEIFVIDNHSLDRTRTLIRESKNPPVLIENQSNLGFAKAVNRGMKQSSGDFILLINPDAVITSESLSPMIDFMRKNPMVGICGCRLLNEDGSLQYSKGSFPTLLSMILRSFLPRPMRKYQLSGYGKADKCDWVTGAFMLIRGSMVRDVGPLDEAYFAYYEDVDYCLQARKSGWDTYYYTGITAYHLNPHATSERSSALQHEIQKSRLFFFRKNKSSLSYYLLLSLTRMFENKCFIPTAQGMVSPQINEKKSEPHET
jgi:GT2 family glycosyltransferase